MEHKEFIGMCHRGINGVYKQGAPSIDGEGNCKYLSPTGLRCVVGHMMPSDEVRKSGDSGTSRGNTVGRVVSKGIWGTTLSHFQLHILKILQDLHDNVARNKCFDRDYFKKSCLEELKLYNEIVSQ